MVEVGGVGGHTWCITGARNEAWYSKLSLPGVAPEFSPFLTIEIPNRTSPVTAVADLDGVPIVFCENEIFTLAGQGLDNNGQGGDFVPQRLVGDIGCVEPRSVISTPIGIWFLSRGGWRLLDRTRQIAKGEGGYVGNAVDDFRDTTVLGVVHKPSTSELVWALDSTTSPLGEDFLVYNYEFNIWTTWVLSGAQPRAITIDDQERLVVATTTGFIWRENKNLWSDNNSATSHVIRTRPLTFAGIEGFQRVRRVTLSLRRKEAYQLTVQMRKDEQAAFTTVKTFTEADLTALDRDSLQVIVPARLQKCTRLEIQLLFSNGSGLTSSETAELMGLQLEVGLKKGPARLGKVARGGGS